MTIENDIPNVTVTEVFVADENPVTETEPTTEEPQVAEAANAEIEQDESSFVSRSVHAVSVPFIAVGRVASAFGHGVHKRARAANDIRRGRNIMQAMMRKQLLEVGRNARDSASHSSK